MLKKLSSNRSGSYSPFSCKFLLERTLFENLLEYWEFLHEPRACTYWWREEKLCGLKRAISKRWPKKFFKKNVLFHVFEKKKLFFNPTIYINTEIFFEQLVWWKELHLEDYLIKYLHLNIKPKRHKKVYGKGKTLRI